MKKLIAIAILSLLSALSIHSEELIIAIAQEESNPVFDRMAVILNEAVDRIDSRLVITLVYIPFERAAYNLRRGLLDGDLLRTEIVYENDSSVIPVSPSIFDLPYYVYSRKDSGIIDSDSLHMLRMAIQDGNVMVEKFAESKDISFTAVKDNNHAIKMLALDRADFFIATGLEGDLVFSELLDQNGVVRSTEPLLFANLYLFLHVKHVKLARSLEPVLREMKESGRFLEILSGSP